MKVTARPGRLRTLRRNLAEHLGLGRMGWGAQLMQKHRASIRRLTKKRRPRR